MLVAPDRFRASAETLRHTCIGEDAHASETVFMKCARVPKVVSEQVS